MHIDKRGSLLTPELEQKLIRIISGSIGAEIREIRNIAPMDSGMTNISYRFTCSDSDFILRLPGEGSGQILDRYAEAEAYAAIEGKGICDKPVFLDPESGIKISVYIDGATVCDINNTSQTAACMAKLKQFHSLRIKTAKRFDLTAETLKYERLLGGRNPRPDYFQIKSRVFALQPFVEAHRGEDILCHIDPVPDNFIFTPANGEVQLIDWEYAAMQDPHVDIVMFGVYAGYDKSGIDMLIDQYFGADGCPEEIRTKIYCYVAQAGLLWSNWGEYKKLMGDDFGDYMDLQYSYARDFIQIVEERLANA